MSPLYLFPFFLLQTDLPVASISATSQGQTLPEDSDGMIAVGYGQLIKLSAEKAVHAEAPSSLIWIVEPASIQVERFPDGQALVLTSTLTPSTITVTQLVTKSDSIAWQRLRIVCGKGAQPPPIPDNPPPSTQRPVRISLISDAMKAGSDEVIIRNATQFWNNIKLQGNDWIFYESTTPEGKGKALIDAAETFLADNKMKEVPFPILVYEEISSEKILSVIKLPASYEAIEAELKKVGGMWTK